MIKSDLTKLTKLADINSDLSDPGIARLVINSNKVLNINTIDGLNITKTERREGVDVKIYLQKGIIIKKPVHLCFGILQKSAVQKINLQIEVGSKSSIDIIAHCIFPNAVNIKHIMNGKVNLDKDSKYTYLEKHIHNKTGKLAVYPHSTIKVGEGARFVTKFELLRGKVGLLDIDYRTTGEKKSSIELESTVSGAGKDMIKIKETALLKGEYARAVLKSRIAVKDNAKAEVYNSIKAKAAYTRGHIDCSEVLQGNGTVKAYPVAEVLHSKARVTHEASLGGVDNRQLETLMARGLTEEQAEELIISGLLS